LLFTALDTTTAIDTADDTYITIVDITTFFKYLQDLQDLLNIKIS